jgi:hypothetical protein
MATTRYGPHEKNVVQITSADTVELMVYAVDAENQSSPQTGLAFGAVTVTYCKPTETSFSAFPSFGTSNWAELGRGWYLLKLRGGTTAELALLNALGPLAFDLSASGAVFPPVCRDVVGSGLMRTADGPASVAAAILETPANLLATDAAGAVTVADSVGLTELVTDIVAALLLNPANLLATDEDGAVTVAGAVGLTELLADIIAGILLTPTNKLATDDDGNVSVLGTIDETAFLEDLAGSPVGSVAGDLGGKVLGGGTGTITDIGARVSGGGGGTPEPTGFPVTVTATLGGVGVLGALVTLQAEGGEIAYRTNANGVARTSSAALPTRPAGSYTLRVAGTGSYADYTGTVVVASDGAATGNAVALTATSLPAPASPDCYALWDNATDENGRPLALNAMSVKVARISPEGLVDPDGLTSAAILGTPALSDANSQWAMDIPIWMFDQEAVLVIEKSWTAADGQPVAQRWEALLAAPESGVRVNWSSLRPRQVG